ncbi:MAG: beta-glucuronidase, partial [Prevotella sp.]
TEHPLFKEFPTDDWSNLNWWELTNDAQVMNLSLFPKSYQSPIQPIDTWHVSRKLGMLFEANVLGGKLIMTTMDISSNLGRRVVARQMRKAIIDYMLSDSFQPTLNLDPKDVTNLFENMAPPVNMFTKDSPDELKPRLKP